MSEAKKSSDKCDLPAIVERLCTGEQTITRRAGTTCCEPLPSRADVIRMAERLRAALFPGFFGISEVRAETLAFHVGHVLDEVQRTMELQIRRCLAFSEDDASEGTRFDQAARRRTAAFFQRLPEVQHLLAGDVRAAYEGDPAARTPDEAVFCYPGVLTITNHRLAHELYRLEVPLLPRIISEHAHSITGIDIHPGAQVGQHFFIDHGTGVVIGETCIIGDRVRIYQGVTLGAKSFPLDEEGKPIKGIPRHPIIEDDVIVYSGATILGRVTIGAGSMIGGNVWLTRDVPPGSRVTVQPAREERFQLGGGI